MSFLPGKVARNEAGEPGGAARLLGSVKDVDLNHNSSEATPKKRS